MRHRSFVVALVLSLAACGGSVAPEGRAVDDDAATDTSASPSPGPRPDDPPPEAGPMPTPVDADATPTAVCCPIDDHPSCCMRYGGTKSETGNCGEICDLLPDPDDPRWQRRIDENGCPYWYAPPEIPIACNPFGPFDSGDAGIAEAAPMDAPTD
jgi:hypothetical protein